MGADYGTNPACAVQFALMRPLALFAIVLGILMAVPANNRDDACRCIKSRRGRPGYDNGGAYTLDHFRLTAGRTRLRKFLWSHWHEHKQDLWEQGSGRLTAAPSKSCT